MRIDLDETALRQWIEDSLATHANILATGYQGKTLFYENNGQKYVIKVPHGKGLVRYFHTRMLRHEYEVYKKLEGFAGIPACYGIVDNQYLVIEFIEGRTIRSKRPLDENEFNTKLLDHIKTMHKLNVAHMDLKRKDNLLVRSDDSPFILDFGAAVIKKEGNHPLNNYHFNLAKQFDYNAWIKHKYHDRMDEISWEDKKLYKVTWVESISSNIKNIFTQVFRR